jgi:hypothetical protein
VYWHRPTLKNVECDGTDSCGAKPEGWEVCYTSSDSLEANPSQMSPRRSSRCCIHTHSRQSGSDVRQQFCLLSRCSCRCLDASRSHGSRRAGVPFHQRCRVRRPREKPSGCRNQLYGKFSETFAEPELNWHPERHLQLQLRERTLVGSLK